MIDYYVWLTNRGNELKQKKNLGAERHKISGILIKI